MGSEGKGKETRRTEKEPISPDILHHFDFLIVYNFPSLSVLCMVCDCLLTTSY